MKSPFEYAFRGETIPPHTADELARYLNEHIPPSELVTAVLCNDFMRAFKAADDENLAAMPVIAAYIYNEVPMAACGSPDAVESWLENAG
jgi:hypothetical protein